MTKPANSHLAIVGEWDPGKRAHAGIEASFALFCRERNAKLRHTWIPTAQITSESVDQILSGTTAIWCAPGSPYTSTAGALLAIRHARIKGKAFLGTCGGFQHALMEHAQNVLGCVAAHEESDPAADRANALIVKLSCSLAGARGRVIADPATDFATLLGGAESAEEFNCNYGVNPDLTRIFTGSDLCWVAHDELGQVRAFRLVDHPFFVGTLFQPERRVFSGELHPLVNAFLESAHRKSGMA